MDACAKYIQAKKCWFWLERMSLLFFSQHGLGLTFSVYGVNEVNKVYAYGPAQQQKKKKNP